MKKLLIVLICLLYIQVSWAQSLSPTVIASAGDYFTNSNGSLSWTMGEAVVTYLSNANNSLSQGFQQSYSITTAIQAPQQGSFSLFAYPNPVLNTLHLQIENTAHDNYQVYLMDMLGRVMIQRSLDFTGTLSTEFDLSTLASGMYFLHVSSSSKELKTFKIEHYN